MPYSRVAFSYRCLVLAACAAGAFAGATAAVAAERGELSAAQIYQRDRAACISGETHQDRATCLREAGAALQEARRGRLDDGQAGYERNRLLRCEKHAAEDREYCVRRMKGEGITSGSVEGGGIYRELVVPVIAPQSN